MAPPAFADAAKVYGAMGLVHRVCLAAWPDFKSTPDIARQEGLENWSDGDAVIWGDPTSGTTVSIVPAEKIMVVTVFPAQCVVSLLDVPIGALGAGLDRHGISLKGQSLRVIERHGNGDGATRSYGNDAGTEVHVLLIDIPENNVVGLAVAPASYR